MMPSESIRTSESRRARWRRHVMAIAGWVILIVAVPMPASGDMPSVLVEIGVGSPHAPRVEHVFGGRSVSVPMVLYGTPGARADLKARLFQLALGFAAPVGESMDIASGIVFSPGLRRELTFDVVIPAVERESRFELVVLLRVHPDDDWRRIGSLSLHAYPKDLLKPLRRWTEHRPLRLRDTSGKLERFLTAQGVSFLDLNARSLEHSDDPVITLLVGGSDDPAVAKRRAGGGEAVIVFRERVVAFPRIERTRWQGGSLLIVEFELLDRLSVDPQAQKLFLEVVRWARSGDRSGEEEVWHERQDPQ